MDTSKKSPNATSNARRDVWCKDEPGVRIFEKKPDDVFETSYVIISRPREYFDSEIFSRVPKIQVVLF